MKPKKHASKIEGNGKKGKNASPFLNGDDKKNNAKESKNSMDERQVKATEKTACWTMILGVFTIILAVVGGYTVRILWLQFNETQIANRIEQRAWLSISKIETHWNGKKPDYFKIYVDNTGKTPAFNVAGWFNKKYSLDDINKLFDTPTPTADTNNFGIIAPKTPLYLKFEIFPKDIVNIKKMSFFIGGKITYSDIFGNPHWIEFSRLPLPNFNTFEFKGIHNRTDDQQNK